MFRSKRFSPRTLPLKDNECPGAGCAGLLSEEAEMALHQSHNNEAAPRRFAQRSGYRR